MRTANEIFIRLEARFRPYVGNTLSRLSTVFTRSAIALPEVNRFGWSLEHCEYTVCRRPWQILGATRAEARNFVFFLSGKQRDFTDFPSAKFHEIWHRRRGSVSRWILSEQNFENFPVRGRFLKKANVSPKSAMSNYLKANFVAKIFND